MHKCFPESGPTSPLLIQRAQEITQVESIFLMQREVAGMFRAALL